MMRYYELKEMTIQDWTGEPFDAYVADGDCGTIKNPVTQRITGFNQAKIFTWITSRGGVYQHVYPVKWNKDLVERALAPEPEPTQKRMTNRQLAQWLAQGNGVKTYADPSTLDALPLRRAYTTHVYIIAQGADECCDTIMVQTWDSEKWVVPTTDLLQKGR